MVLTRLEIENRYSTELSELVREYSDVDKKSQSSHLLELISVLQQDNTQIALLFKTYFEKLTAICDSYKVEVTDFKTHMQPYEAKQQPLMINVEKYKNIYSKLVKNSKDKDTSAYKTQEQLASAEQDYKMAVVRLEEFRSKSCFSRDQAKSRVKELDSKSFQAINEFFVSYGQALNGMGNNLKRASAVFDKVTAKINPLEFDTARFNLDFVYYSPVYFEIADSGVVLRDLIFGVPLTFSIRQIPEVIPPFLRLSMSEIERRGGII